jgi:hypothetical protein
LFNAEVDRECPLPLSRLRPYRKEQQILADMEAVWRKERAEPGAVGAGEGMERESE